VLTAVFRSVEVIQFTDRTGVDPAYSGGLMASEAELEYAFIREDRLEVFVHFIKPDIAHLIVYIPNQHGFKRVVDDIDHIAEHDYSAMSSGVLLVGDDEDESQIITDDSPMHYIDILICSQIVRAASLMIAPQENGLVGIVL